MKIYHKLMSFALALCMVMLISVQAMADTRPYAKEMPAAASEITVGSYITFGSYHQRGSGTDKTPIEWLVLEMDGNDALLISRYGLDSQRYSTNSGNAIWENATLRTWLNNDFLNEAFTQSEQGEIYISLVDNDSSQNNNKWKTTGGSDTYDKIFILSHREAEKYFASAEARRCAPTDYSVEQRLAYVSDQNVLDGRACGWWWLRSPGSMTYEAAGVYSSGALGGKHGAGDLGGMVRPAMWVDLTTLR